MTHILLLGAGFSRNWGGWLASETFEYLLGCPEIAKDKRLIELLWKHQSGGGFEDVLAELQIAFRRDRNTNAQQLKEFQSAVSRMFEDMNSAFLETTDWEFQNNRPRLVKTFLTKFDAIFTLNQDVLIEHFYHNDNIDIIVGKRRDYQIPGMRRVPFEEGLHTSSWARSTWIPLPEHEFEVEKNVQPYFKLHGSSNWKDNNGSDLLVMGGAKSMAINQSPILKWYAKIFDEFLSGQNVKLMVIGYGFRDQHINEALMRGMVMGMKIFVIAPEGAKAAIKHNQINTFTPSETESLLQRSLIGASQRLLKDTFSNDIAEFRKVMRFFEP